MNVIFKWILEHPDVELMMHSYPDSPKQIVFCMTHKYESTRIKFVFDPVWYNSKAADDDYTFIFNEMYDRLLSQHKIGIMMEDI